MMNKELIKGETRMPEWRVSFKDDGTIYGHSNQSEQKRYKLIEEERDLLLNNPGLQELARNVAKAKEEYDTFLALLRK